MNEAQSDRPMRLQNFTTGAVSLLFLILCAEAQFARVQYAGPGFGSLELRLLLGLVVLPSICIGVSILWNQALSRALWNLLFCWRLFILYVAVSAFTRFPGLIKGMDRTPRNFALTVITYSLYSLPFLISQAGVLWLWH